MIVAMVSMWVMQMASNQIVCMVSMWNCFMATIGSVNVFRIMSTSATSASIGIDAADFNSVLVHMISMHVMKMAVV